MGKYILTKFVFGTALFAVLVLNTFAQNRPVPDQELIAKRNQIEKELAEVAVIDRKVMVTMRDGKRMAADVYRPKDASKKYPIIFSRTPYNFNFWEAEESAAPSRFYALIFDHEHLARRFDFPLEVIRIDRPEIFSQYSAITSYTAIGAVINIYFGGGNLTGTIILAGAQTVSVKFHENHLTVVDNCGRLLVYDYRNRQLKNSLRL